MAEYLIDLIMGLDPIESVAVAFGILSVLLIIRQNIWCWPAGLVMVSLYIYIFIENELRMNAGLHVLYIGLHIYGWYRWSRGGAEDEKLKVTRIGMVEAIIWPIVAVIASVGLGLFMFFKTMAIFAFLDATTVVLSLIAQFLMARKILECWAIWITVDVIYISLFISKAMYPSLFLYSVFLVLAGMGLFEWRRSCLKTARE